MVKREYQDIEDEDEADNSPTTTSVKQESIFNETMTLTSAKTTPKKKAKSSPSKSSKDVDLEEEGNTPKSSPAKGRWNHPEDDILIGMMEKIIKDHIWAMAKTDGRLVSRTCYGVQYHALMLLRQGTGKGPN